MRTIYKYLAKPGHFAVMMPRGAEVLSVHMQRDDAVIWAIVDPEEPSMERTFEAFGTGHPLPAKLGRFVGTFLVDGGSLVWHLFEI